ncbi:MAG: hypothetical protein ABL996_14665 [Micropepsaceae bacterium]
MTMFIFSATNDGKKMNMVPISMPKVLKNLVEVGNRLEQLGLTKDQLEEVVDAMVAARADCTDNDPPGARGWSAWRMGTRRLREILLSVEGWEKDDSDQISSVMNRQLGIRIAVSNTDDGTGVDENDRYPQNRSRKGAATDGAIQRNQGSFLAVLDASLNVVQMRLRSPSPLIVTWYLCVYCEGDEFRAELACPSAVEGGFFSDFKERIFLGSSDDGKGKFERLEDGDETPEFEIQVTRKKN